MSGWNGKADMAAYDRCHPDLRRILREASIMVPAEAMLEFYRVKRGFGWDHHSILAMIRRNINENRTRMRREELRQTGVV